MSASRIRHVALVVDDVPILRLEVVDMLEEAGFEVGGVKAARAVLESRHDVTLLFTDVHLWRGQEGVALAHEVADRWPPVAIIVCSALPEVKVDRLPAKARFIGRPYHAGQALRMLEQMLR